LPKDMILDGELYHHGTSLQTINSWIKKEKPETKNIVFNVYDCAVLDRPQLLWPDRWDILSKWFSEAADQIVGPLALTETRIANNKEEVMEMFAHFLSEKYEGAMARMSDGVYRFGYRSKRLLKLKEFRDAEFEVIGYKTGIGRYSECPIWSCKTKSGEVFDVVQKGTMEEKKEMLAEADSFIGKFLTVKYFELSNDGKPIFPVGVAFRLEEDMPKDGNNDKSI
jgi:DNA ligase-1